MTTRLEAWSSVRDAGGPSSSCDPGNVAMVKVFERIGFERFR